jgi:hypothetical protein
MRSANGFPRWVWICVSLCGALLLATGPANAEGVIYFADIFYPDWSDGYVYSVNTDGTELQVVVNTGGGLRGIAVDDVARKLYWTDVDSDIIWWANMDGSDPEDIIVSGMAWPMGIAVHPTADALAWGDQTLQQLSTAHLNGGDAAPLFATPFHSGIAIDRINDKIYWTTSNTSSDGGIHRCNLDGSAYEAVLTDWDKPHRIALDVEGGKIYWTDYVVDKVRRANLDGTGWEELYDVGANLNPGGIALDLAAGKVYWGQAEETNRCKIMRMNLDGSNPEDVLAAGGFGIITDLVFFSGSSDVVDTKPTKLLHGENWPNPFAGTTAMSLHLPEDRFVRMMIYAIDGRHIATLASRTMAAGRHEIQWDGTDARGRHAPNGTYYCRIEAGDLSQTRKLTLSR